MGRSPSVADVGRPGRKNGAGRRQTIHYKKCSLSLQPDPSRAIGHVAAAFSPTRQPEFGRKFGPTGSPSSLILTIGWVKAEIVLLAAALCSRLVSRLGFNQGKYGELWLLRAQTTQ